MLLHAKITGPPPDPPAPPLEPPWPPMPPPTGQKVPPLMSNRYCVGTAASPAPPFPPAAAPPEPPPTISMAASPTFTLPPCPPALPPPPPPPPPPKSPAPVMAAVPRLPLFEIVPATVHVPVERITMGMFCPPVTTVAPLATLNDQTQCSPPSVQVPDGH